MALNAEISSILTSGAVDLNGLSDADRVRFNFAMTSIFRNFENVYYQYANGSIDDATWAPWARRIRGVLVTEGS
jgi:hypothetical protein